MCYVPLWRQLENESHPHTKVFLWIFNTMFCLAGLLDVKPLVSIESVRKSQITFLNIHDWQKFFWKAKLCTFRRQLIAKKGMHLTVLLGGSKLTPALTSGIHCAMKVMNNPSSVIMCYSWLMEVGCCTQVCIHIYLSMEATRKGASTMFPRLASWQWDSKKQLVWCSFCHSFPPHLLLIVNESVAEHWFMMPLW